MWAGVWAEVWAGLWALTEELEDAGVAELRHVLGR